VLLHVAAFHENVAIGNVELEALSDDDIDNVQFVEPEEQEELLDALRTCGTCAEGSKVTGTGKDGFVRLGDPNKGGYVMCGSALSNTSMGFSVGVTGNDLWGQQVSERVGVPVHEFDCYRRPPGTNGTANAHYHPVCVDATFSDPKEREAKRKEQEESETRTGKLWSALSWAAGKLLALTPLAPKEFAPMELLVERTLGKQTAAEEGHPPVETSDTNLVLKMDVDGAEWGVLFGAEDDFFNRFRQVVVVLHRLDEPSHYRVYAHCLRKLLKNFVVVHTHGDNEDNLASVELPGHGRNFTLPASLEVTLVRKDLATAAPCQSARRVEEDKPDVPDKPDPEPFLPDDEVEEQKAEKAQKQAQKKARQVQKKAQQVKKEVAPAPANATAANVTALRTKAEKVAAAMARMAANVTEQRTKAVAIQAIADAAKAAARVKVSAEASARPASSLVEKKAATTTAAPDTAAGTLEQPIPGAPSSLLTFAPWRGPGVSMKALAKRWQDRERKQQEQEEKDEEEAGERAREGLAAVTVDPFATQLRTDDVSSPPDIPPTYGLTPPGADFDAATSDDFSADFSGTDVAGFGSD